VDIPRLIVVRTTGSSHTYPACRRTLPQRLNLHSKRVNDYRREKKGRKRRRRRRERMRGRRRRRRRIEEEKGEEGSKARARGKRWQGKRKEVPHLFRHSYLISHAQAQKVQSSIHAERDVCVVHVVPAGQEALVEQPVQEISSMHAVCV
jgi:hypothetical protein